VGLIALNFTGGEKKLEEQVRHEYGLHDAQYQRALGVLLGPPTEDVELSHPPHGPLALRVRLHRLFGCRNVVSTRLPGLVNSLPRAGRPPTSLGAHHCCP
jgi:hypothetical protein